MWKSCLSTMVIKVEDVNGKKSSRLEAGGQPFVEATGALANACPAGFQYRFSRQVRELENE